MVAIQSADSPISVVSALAQASRRTGVDFDYLLHTAQRESGLKTQAKAKTSSAAGLFQFIEQTWLELARKYGAEAGMGALSDKIATNANGRHYVSDPAVKQEILALRHDASLSAFMAGKMTQDSKVRLEKALGRPLKDNELYAAHFLGVSGAVKLLKAVAATPGAPAADIFPNAARVNKPLFYDAAGAPKSLAGLYQTLTGLTPKAAVQKQTSVREAIPALLSSDTPTSIRQAPNVAPFRQSPQTRVPFVALYQKSAQDSFPPLPAQRSGLAGLLDSRLLLSAPVLDLLSALDMRPKGTVAAYRR